ncbi:MAG: MerR family transcriptional regulator [Rhodanobacteraceae bacterium]
MNGLSIGEACRQLGISADTLRYYERIKLMPRIARDTGDRRRYANVDMERLRFVQRAQSMDFTLAEIRELLQLRERPGNPRKRALALASDKLVAIKERLATLTQLRNELSLLVNLCTNAADGCPILEGLATTSGKRAFGERALGKRRKPVGSPSGR